MSKKKSQDKDPNVESEVWTDITYTCPKRGIVTEKVRVKRIKPQSAPVPPNPFDLEIIKELIGSDDEN